MEAGKAAGKETLNAGKRQMEVLKAIGKQARERECASRCASGEPQAKHRVPDHIPTSRALRRAPPQPPRCRRFGLDFAQCSAVG